MNRNLVCELLAGAEADVEAGAEGDGEGVEAVVDGCRVQTVFHSMLKHNNITLYKLGKINSRI